ncbi:MAG: type II CAAX prenyl endopeptidase Rce1 family protein [Leptolyngbyaceae cyanobacterium]
MMRWWLARYRQIASAWVMWRIVAFFGALLILWLPFGLLTYGLGALFGHSQATDTLAVVTLYGCFIGNAWIWGRWIHRWQRPFYTYGLVADGRFVGNLAIALPVGFSLVCLLFGAQVLLGWAESYPRPLAAIALEGLAVGLGVGLAEEVLFRGWLLAELQIGLPRSQAIFWSSVIFAIAHFIKPLPEILQTSPQFLGLVLLGMLLAAARHISLGSRFTSLGLPIGLHAGLVWGYYIVDVADLVVPSSQVPAWVTGIHGNPLSGVLGIGILACLTVLAGLRLRSK